MRTYVRIRSYGFTITEYDPDRPWIILGYARHQAELDDQVTPSPQGGREDGAGGILPRSRVFS